MSQIRNLKQIPVTINNIDFQYTPDTDNYLTKAIINDFAPRFLHDAVLVYVSNTSDNSAYHDDKLIMSLNIPINEHNKLPDVIFFIPDKRWLVLVDSVAGHGIIDDKRHKELTELFSGVNADIMYVTAFPNRSIMSEYFAVIDWETVVWIANEPDHLIHLNGQNDIQPYL